MINLQPIHSEIRAELHRRQKLLNREGILFEGPQTDGTGKKKADANNIFAKSTWIRMVGKAVGKPPVIIGGGLLKENESAYYGFEDMYNSPRNIGEVGADNKFRPMPGVKSISVEYKNTLATLRSATINWTCWSFDDISKYTPYFLSPGGIIILEWGYSYSDNDITLYDANTEIVDLVSAHRKMIDNAFSSKGTYDGMAGMVTNFEWSTRDDGGIDCTTNMSSMGLDILKQRIVPVDNINVTKTDKNDHQKVELQQNFQKFLAEISTKLDKYRGDNKGMPLQWVSKNPAAYQPVAEIATGGWQTAIIHNTTQSSEADELYISWGWIEDNILSKYLSKVDKQGKIISSIRSIEPILDNSGYQHSIKSALEAEKISTEEADGLPEGNHAWESTEISNHEHLISPDFNFFILPGQSYRNDDDLTVHPILANFNKDFPKFKSNRVVGGTSEPVAGSSTPPKKNLQVGLMRNIMFNWNYLITNVFNDASDITSALKKLFERMNENVGIWDLKLIASHDMPATLKIVDMNLAKYSVQDLLKLPSKLKDDWENVEGGLFHFPVMGKNSIVTAQSLNAKITNEMAMSMMWKNSTKIISPSQAGGIKTVATSHLGNDSDIKDAFIDEIQPGWTFTNFGNKMGMANTKFDTESGPDININTSDVTTDKSSKNKDNHDNENVETVKRIQTLKFTEEQFWNFNFQKDAGETNQIAETVYGTGGKMENDPETNKPWLDVMKYLIAYDEKESVSVDFDPMTTLEISLTLDGISGIFPGNCFTSNYLPAQYKDRVLFQVMSSTQELDGSSWKTTINGLMRISVSNQRSSTQRNFLEIEKEETQKQSESYEDKKARSDFNASLGYKTYDKI